MIKILCFITKATSSLDYLIPLINYSKTENPEIKFEIIIWNKVKDLLRDQPFYESFLKMNKYEDFYTLLNQHTTTSTKLLWTNFIYRRINRVNSQDSYNIATKAISNAKPDIIIYDHREIKKFGIDSLKKAIIDSKITTVLIPHAPHHTGTEAFVSFTKTNPLPEKFKYWTAFKFDNYAGNFSEKQKAQFKYIGYPGLDFSFLNKLKMIPSKNLTDIQNTDCVKVVLILRKIFPKKITTQPINHDNYAFFYREFFDLLINTHGSLNKSLKNFELYLKPHPATNINLLKKLISETKLKNVYIDNDSIYSQLNRFDIFISFYTTTILIPMANRQLTFILDSRIQNEIRHWEPLKKLYDDSPAFIKKPSELGERLNNLHDASEQEKYIDKCYSHLRNYYPDNSSELAINEIKEIYKNVKK